MLAASAALGALLGYLAFLLIKAIIGWAENGGFVLYSAVRFRPSTAFAAIGLPIYIAVVGMFYFIWLKVEGRTGILVFMGVAFAAFLIVPIAIVESDVHAGSSSIACGSWISPSAQPTAQGVNATEATAACATRLIEASRLAFWVAVLGVLIAVFGTTRGKDKPAFRLRALPSGP